MEFARRMRAQRMHFLRNMTEEDGRKQAAEENKLAGMYHTRGFFRQFPADTINTTEQQREKRRIQQSMEKFLPLPPAHSTAASPYAYPTPMYYYPQAPGHPVGPPPLGVHPPLSPGSLNLHNSQHPPASNPALEPNQRERSGSPAFYAPQNLKQQQPQHDPYPRQSSAPVQRLKPYGSQSKDRSRWYLLSISTGRAAGFMAVILRSTHCSPAQRGR